MFYLGKLYYSKSEQNIEDTVIVQPFYTLTSYDKDMFSSLREEANREIDSIDKSAYEMNGSGKFFHSLRNSNSNLPKHLSSHLKFSRHNKRLCDIISLLL